MGEVLDCTFKASGQIRLRGQTVTHPMGSLPSARVRLAEVIAHVGIDYSGQ